MILWKCPHISIVCDDQIMYIIRNLYHRFMCTIELFISSFVILQSGNLCTHTKYIKVHFRPNLTFKVNLIIKYYQIGHNLVLLKWIYFKSLSYYNVKQISSLEYTLVFKVSKNDDFVHLSYITA